MSEQKYRRMSALEAIRAHQETLSQEKQLEEEARAKAVARESVKRRFDLPVSEDVLDAIAEMEHQGVVPTRVLDRMNPADVPRGVVASHRTFVMVRDWDPEEEKKKK